MAAKGSRSTNIGSGRSIIQLIQSVKERLLLPLRLATSKVALRAYLTSILFAATGLLLFSFAIAAYVLFYWSYIPRIGFSRDIHLQFDTIPLECRNYLGQLPHTIGTPLALLNDVANSQSRGRNELSTTLSARCAGTPQPWGTTSINPEVINQQAYDIVVELTLPRTPLNSEAGNFMLDARLLTNPSAATDLPRFINAYDPSYSPSAASPITDTVLAHSRRPALIPYEPPMFSLASTLTSLPWWFIGLRSAPASTHLRIPLFSTVTFPRGRRNLPTTLHLQIQNPSGVQLQVAKAEVHFRAQFKGLRYLMYNFRSATAAMFIGAFWLAECITALAVWGLLNFVIFGERPNGSGGSGQAQGSTSDQVKQESQAEDDRRIKREDEEEPILSDTERTFPSYGSGPAMHYPGKKQDDPPQSSPAIGSTVDGLMMTPGLGTEADDEDDEDADFVLDDTGGWRDSGLGTSVESGRERGVEVLRRRRSRAGKEMLR